jgi:hypothetical protein
MPFGQTDRQTDITKLIVAFCRFVKSPENKTDESGSNWRQISLLVPSEAVISSNKHHTFHRYLIACI